MNNSQMQNRRRMMGHYYEQKKREAQQQQIFRSRQQIFRSQKRVCSMGHPSVEMVREGLFYRCPKCGRLELKYKNLNTFKYEVVSRKLKKKRTLKR